MDVTIPPGVSIGPADVAVVLTPARGRAFAPGGYVYEADPTGLAAPITTQAATANTGPARNPVSARVLAGGVVMVSATQANTVTDQLLRTSVRTLAKARVINEHLRTPFALVVPGLVPLQRYTVAARITPSGSSTPVAVGSFMTNASGQLALPVLVGSKPVSIVLTIRNTTTHAAGFLRIVIR